MSDNQNLNARLAHVEDRLERIEQAETATDDDGREWSVPQLVEWGLTRRQAMLAVGSLAVYGGSIWGAIKYATGNARAATDQVGTPNQRADVFAETVDTDEATVNNLSAEFEKTSNQSISASTDTTIDWDSQTVDSDIYTYDSSNDDLTVLKKGDYQVAGAIEMTGNSEDDRVYFRVVLNGSVLRDFINSSFSFTGATGAYVVGTVTLKDLSANDVLRFDARSDGSGTLQGDARRSYATVTRLG